MNSKLLKKLCAVLVIITVLCVTVLTLTLSTSAATYSGTCGDSGDNVTWSLDTATGVFTISGTGNMKSNYTSYSQRPWHSYRSNIKSVVIEDGVTSIGIYAFRNCNYLNSITIPDSVTKIEKEAFYGCLGLTEIKLPEKLVSIGDSAFYGCNALTSIDIPDSVTAIGTYAFCGCSTLTSITIPKGVVSISNYTFQSCSALQNVTFHDNVKTIGAYAFKSCTSLNEVVFPNSITSIGQQAFYGCKALNKISYCGLWSEWTKVTKGSSWNYNVPGSPALHSYEEGKCVGCGIDYVECAHTTITSSGNCEYCGIFAGNCGTDILWTFDKPTGVLTISGTGAIPDYYSGSSARPGYAHKSYITSIVIEDGITGIGDYSFYSYSKLATVTIPESVTNIGNSSFYQCNALKEVVIPENVLNIESSAFSYCSALTDVIIGDGVKTIESYAFNSCSKLSNIDIPQSVESIGEYAFSYCYALETVSMSNKLKSISNYAFYYCKSLKTIIYCGTDSEWESVSKGNSWNSGVPGTVKFHDYSVENKKAVCSVCKLSIDVEVCGEHIMWTLNPETGTLILSGTGVMTDYSAAEPAPWYDQREYIKTLIIDDAITSIGNYAFKDCTALTDVVISDGIADIGDYAFYGCTDVTKVVMTTSVKNIGANAFADCDSLEAVIYCGGTLDWSGVSLGKNWLEIAGIFSLHNYVGAVCTECSAVAMSGVCGENVTWAFDSATGTLTISGTGDMFNDCTDTSNPWLKHRLSIKTIVIENGVTSIGDYVFYYTKNLTSVTIPESVTKIGTYAFAKCETITSITLPDSITEIGGSAFLHCLALTSINLPSKLTVLNEYILCAADITSITIPAGVKSIERGAFSQCLYITEIVIPDGVESIGQAAFESCQKMTSITIPDSVQSIGKSAFLNCLKLTSVVVPEGVKEIGDYTFHNCYALTSVIFPSSIESIGENVFANSSITSISIPGKVKSIGSLAFYSCANLKTLIFCGTPYQWKFMDRAEDWNKNSTQVVVQYHNYVDEICTECGRYEFEKEKICKHITVENEKCVACGAIVKVSEDGLTWVFDPNNGKLTVSGQGAMKDYIAEQAPWYEYRSKIVTVIIKNGVTCVGNQSFYNFNNLECIILPKSVTRVGTCSFYNCRVLTTLVYCGSEEEWNKVTKGSAWDYPKSPEIQFHNYVDGVCTECGDDPNATECEHTTIENGLCTECKAWDGVTPVIFAAGVSLGEDLTINYYAYIPEHMYNVDMRFTMNDKVVIVRGSYEENENSYLFVFDGIAPQLMGDNIKAELVFEDEIIATKDNYSILQNAKNLLEDLDEDNEAVVLIKAMLNYGAAAQQYADYNSDAPVNSGYETDGVAPDASVSVRDIVNNTGDSIFKAAGVYFNNVNKLYVKITSAEKPAVSINGEEAVVESYGNGEWIVYTDGILVTDFDETFTFVITSNPQLPTLTYSINSYTYVKQGSENAKMRALAIATYAYGVAAEAFNK